MTEIKTLDCGCEVIVATNGSVMLTYCPLHKSAPDLYEALKQVHEIASFHNDGRGFLEDIISTVEPALSKARL